MKKFAKRYAGILFAVLMLSCLAAAGLTYHREIWAVFTQQAARDALVARARGAGAWGLAVFFGLQVLQVVAAFLPGEPVELAAGLLYGAWGGLAVCLAGALLGAACIYFFVRAAGARAVSESALQKYPLLRDEAHVKFFLFMIFFIPGTPKDLLTYAGPFLPVRARDFLLLSTLARIPSILSSTFTADAFAAGRWQIGAAVYAATGLAAGLCIWQQERLLRALRTWKTRRALEKKGKP